MTGMSPKSRKPADADKRQYLRHPINDWLLLFDNESIIDMAQVVNISIGGALCVSLADTCPPKIVEKVELYGPDSSLAVNGLCGRIIHTDYNKASSVSSENINCFIFGIQFFQTTPEQLQKIDKITRQTS
jgi:hypothetical protein